MRNHWKAEAIRFRFAADKDTTAILSIGWFSKWPTRALIGRIIGQEKTIWKPAKVDNPTKSIVARFKVPTKHFKSGLYHTVRTRYRLTWTVSIRWALNKSFNQYHLELIDEHVSCYVSVRKGWRVKTVIRWVLRSSLKSGGAGLSINLSFSH